MWILNSSPLHQKCNKLNACVYDTSVPVNDCISQFARFYPVAHVYTCTCVKFHWRKQCVTAWLRRNDQEKCVMMAGIMRHTKLKFPKGRWPCQMVNTKQSILKTFCSAAGCDGVTHCWKRASHLTCYLQ